MTAGRASNKFDGLQSALKKLEEVMDRPETDSIVIDAAIQRFEFTFELAWKVMKDYLEYQGLRIPGPRECIKEAFKYDLIKKGDAWIDMLEKRNLTSHLYDEKMALEIFRAIKEKYVAMFKEFVEEMSTRLN